MNAEIVAALLLLCAYLVGSIPFGYLIGRLRGVDLFREGSGNIGATNVSRVLGRKWGLIVFLLDFAKGAVPVAAIVPLADALHPGAATALGPADVLRVAAALLAFLGHIFPVTLGFRGGKGVATGAGTIVVLVPGPALLAVAFWFVVFLAARTVSLASLAAVAILVLARLLGTPHAFSQDALPLTLFVLIGTAVVVVKHRSNVQRLLSRTEKPIMVDGPFRQNALRIIHVLALGLWFGGAGFFNLVVALSIFRSFTDVVNAGPSDRTAGQTLISQAATAEEKKALASALAGSAVGPVFPKYFAMQAICGALALVTALAWRNAEGNRPVHRLRVRILAVALVVVAVSWPLSNYVSELRVQRFDANEAVRAAAVAAFGPWHRASLLLSFVSILLSGIALALAAKLPPETPRTTLNLPTATP